MMAWAHALRVSLWQLLGAFAMFGVAAVLDTVAQIELPRAVSGVALLVGAQAYASAKELKEPGDLSARPGRIAWRAAVLTTTVQLVLAGIMIAVQARVETDAGRFVAWTAGHLWVMPVVVAIAYGMIFLATFFGIRFGAGTARRAAQRRAAG